MADKRFYGGDGNLKLAGIGFDFEAVVRTMKLGDHLVEEREGFRIAF
jgi:hypothetical protein